MTMMFLDKISSFEARVNVNRSEFQEMMNRVMRFPFSKRIVEVEAASKYTALKVNEYKRDSDPYEYICHFEEKMQTMSFSMVK